MPRAPYTTIALALLGMSTAAQADYWNARNQAMGGTGVASSNYDAASTVNPALLTEFNDDDDIALIIPSLGAEVSDRDDVVDTLDNISDDFTTLEEQIDAGDTAGAFETAGRITEDLYKASGDPVYGDVGGRIAIAIPGKTVAIGVDLRTRIEGGALGTFDETDALLIAAAIETGESILLDDVQSYGAMVAAGISELAVSLATEFTPGNSRLSIGITPKLQRVDTVLYVQRANDFDSSDFDYDDFGTDATDFNMDIGAAWWFTEKMNLGLAVSNVVSRDYDTVEVEGIQSTFEMRPLATAGIAWNGGMFTWAFDADLTKRKTFTELGDTQYLRGGFEFNAADWVALRAGVRYDLEDTRDNVVTLGVGFAPFTVFNFDITGVVGENNTYGGGFRV